jgi:hypothetical protein
MDWKQVQDVFNAGIRSSKHCSIASVDKHGRPHVTPIGFVFLREDKTAFYFEQYTKTLPENYAHSKNICIMVINSGFYFWFRSLFRGKFRNYPGLRFYGEVGDLRQASSVELAQLEKRIGGAKNLKGAQLIWANLRTVRDIKITAVSPVRYPRMMEHLE